MNRVKRHCGDFACSGVKWRWVLWPVNLLKINSKLLWIYFFFLAYIQKTICKKFTLKHFLKGAWSIPREKFAALERALCRGLIVTDSNGIQYSVLRTERPLCVQLTGRPWQNKASPSPTQKCGCLCNFNWSVFVEWGLYLLMAWGLCLPSLVEAKCHITEA